MRATMQSLKHNGRQLGLYSRMQWRSEMPPQGFASYVAPRHFVHSVPHKDSTRETWKCYSTADKNGIRKRYLKQSTESY